MGNVLQVSISSSWEMFGNIMVGRNLGQFNYERKLRKIHRRKDEIEGGEKERWEGDSEGGSKDRRKERKKGKEGEREEGREEERKEGKRN